jgi:type II secretory pathway predicted ATPase ExeA
LNLEETDRYVRHRLKAAGHSSGDLFAGDALDRMWQVSRGVPRELNRFGKLAMEVASLKGRTSIEREIIEILVNDFARQQEKAA